MYPSVPASTPTCEHAAGSATATAPLLEMRSITKEFSGVTALADVTLAIRDGESHAICGETGAGKSTLMRVLSGAYPHGTYAGELVYRGKPCRFGSVRASERAGIVIVSQEPALIPELSIADNILLGTDPTRMGGVDWLTTRRLVGDLLTEVGLHHDPDTPVRELGAAGQQLVEIAKAVARGVRLLILDEPTAALTESETAHLLRLIRRLKGRGVTSILISHKIKDIARVADRVTILRDGRTIETIDVPDHDGDDERIVRLRNAVNASCRGVILAPAELAGLVGPCEPSFPLPARTPTANLDKRYADPRLLVRPITSPATRGQLP